MEHSAGIGNPITGGSLPIFEDEDLPPAPPSLRVALVRAFEATRASLAALAASLRLKLMHFTSTLLVVVTDVSSGASAAAQLGDGAILCVDTLQPVVLPPPRTDEDNPYTIALDDWRDGMVLTESAVPPSSGWLLVTDGALQFFPECGSACRTLLTQPADPAQQSVQLLQWLHGLSKTDWEDDRTVAAILTP